MSYAYTGCAVSLSLVHGVGFYLRSNVRLITAILYIGSADREQLFNDVLVDLSAACKCLIFTAAATAYIFASLFLPGTFNFQDPVPQPPPPLPPPIQPNDEEEAGPLVIYDPKKQIDPRLLAAVAPHLKDRRLSLTTPQWIQLNFGGQQIRVNAADPSLHRLVAAMMQRPMVSLEPPGEVAVVVRGKTVYLDPAAFRDVTPDRFAQAAMSYFGRQFQAEAEENEDSSEDMDQMALSSSFVLLSEADILSAADHALKMNSLSLTERLSRMFERQDHITKQIKYREFLRQMCARLHDTNLDIPAIRNLIDRLKKATAFKAAAQKFCFALYGPDGDDDLRPVQNEKATYQNMVDALCEIWETPEYQNKQDIPEEVIEFFQHAFLLRYCLDFGQFFDELVTFASGPLTVQLTLENMWEVFELKNNLLHQIDPKKGGIAGIDQYGQMAAGEFGLRFCPSRGSNVPNRNAILPLSHGGRIHILRHSTPIYQDTIRGAAARAALEVAEKMPWCLDSDADGFFDQTMLTTLDAYSDADTIVPGDFLGMIDSLGARKFTMLHLVLEARTKGQERSRWKRRVGLENDNFFPLALAFDGSFFHGKRQFKKNLKTFEQLRETFITRLLQGKGNYYISPQIAPSEDVLRELCNEVHALFFDERQDIVRDEEYDEHQAYLLLCYVYLTAYLLQHHKIDYLDGGCKDFLDRGGVFAACFSMLVLMLLEKENDHQSLLDVLNNLWAPPIIVKKKGVLNERAEMFKFVVHALRNMPAERVEQLRKGRFNGWLADFLVPKVKDQGIYPSGTTAVVQSEYDAFVHHLRDLHDGELEILGIKPDLLEGLARLPEANIRHQVTRDKLHILFDDQPVASADALELLLQQNGFDDPAVVLKIMSASHQGIADAVTAELQKRFNNGKLHIQLLQDTSKTENLRIVVKVRKEGLTPVASIHMTQIYTLRRVNGVMHQHRIIGTTTIDDHRIGSGTIRCGVLPDADFE
jgi:hypothetical protein